MMDDTQRISYLDVPTPLGGMRLAVAGQALLGAWFLDQHDVPALSPTWRAQPDSALLQRAATQLRQWFLGQRKEFDVRLQPRGTEFQQDVWQALQTLAFGATTSYGELAQSIGRSNAVRAVAGAIGQNPISIFIPCHRVVGRDTSLTGFGGGLARKQALLAHEGHRYTGRAARAKRVCAGQGELFPDSCPAAL